MQRKDAGVMDCPKCHLTRTNGSLECPRCGLIFSKYHPRQESQPPEENIHVDYGVIPEKSSLPRQLWDIFFEVELTTNPFFFLGRALVFVILLIWGGKFIFSSPADARIMNGFWHLVNTPFHEAGHIIFRLFGTLITSLGGSLFQLLMPFICGSVLLIKTRDAFGASVCLWWMAENFMDISPYINDARSLSLPLLGGNTGQTSPYGFHDWELILTETGLLRYDHSIALAAHILGAILMSLALTWAAFLLYKQYRNMKD
jgi:hypothetical protein